MSPMQKGWAVKTGYTVHGFALITNTLRVITSLVRVIILLYHDGFHITGHNFTVTVMLFCTIVRAILSDYFLNIMIFCGIIAKHQDSRFQHHDLIINVGLFQYKIQAS